MGNTLDVVEIKCSLGTKKMSDFLATSPDALTSAERDIQEALSFIYRKNEEKGLFGTFPDWHKNPLTIDCTHVPEKESKFSGNYSPVTNKIELEKSTKDTDLINILSHELKHAEQATKEVTNLGQRNDHLTEHQVGFLQEAQAYPFGMYVSLLKAQEDYATDPKKSEESIAKWEGGLFGKMLDIFFQGDTVNLDYPQLEEQLMITALPILYNSTYKVIYDERNPLGINDSGLSQIPKSFPFKKEPSEALIKKLLETPREPHRHNASWLAYNQKYEEALQEILKQDNDGHYTSSWIERFNVSRSFLKAENHINFSNIVQLLAAKDKSGEPLISDTEKEIYLEKLFEEHGKQNIFNKIFRRDTITEKFRLLKQEPDIFPKKTIDVFISTDVSSSRNLKHIDSEQQQKILFLTQVTSIPKEIAGRIIRDAMEAGFVKTAKTALDKIEIPHSDLIQVLKSQSHIYNKEDINVTQRNNKVQIINAILNLKDKDGHPVISEQDVQMLLYKVKNFKTEGISPLEEAFDIYQKKNPSDQRFISSDAIRLQVAQTFEQKAAELRKKYLSETNKTQQPTIGLSENREKPTSNQTSTGISSVLAKTQNPVPINKGVPATQIPSNPDPRSGR